MIITSLTLNPQILIENLVNITEKIKTCKTKKKIHLWITIPEMKLIHNNSTKYPPLNDSRKSPALLLAKLTIISPGVITITDGLSSFVYDEMADAFCHLGICVIQPL